MTDKLRLVFDIETDGFGYTSIHCLVLLDIDTGMLYSFANQPGFPSIAEGLHILSLADEVIGHSIISFDLPAIRKMHKINIPRERVKDTLPLARGLWPDLRAADATITDMPSALVARHSLEAWGYRVGLRKGTFAQRTDWARWTPDMQTYCERDVEVTAELYLRIEAELKAREADSHADPFLQMAGTR